MKRLLRWRNFTVGDPRWNGGRGINVGFGLDSVFKLLRVYAHHDRDTGILWLEVGEYAYEVLSITLRYRRRKPEHRASCDASEDIPF